LFCFSFTTLLNISLPMWHDYVSYCYVQLFSHFLQSFCFTGCQNIFNRSQSKWQLFFCSDFFITRFA
jgi:hypothetical protein